MNIIETSNNFLIFAALLKAPESMVKEISDWAISLYIKDCYDKTVQIINEKSEQYNYKYINHLKIQKGIFKKYIKPNLQNPKTFSIDLSNLPFSEVDLNLIKSIGLDTISVTFLNKKSEAKKYHNEGFSGLWQAPKTMIIVKEIPEDLYTPQIEQDIIDIKNTVRHELQHLVQSYLHYGKAINEIGGLPSRKIRDKEYNPHGYSTTQQSQQRVEHEKQDIEFYTDLTDSIEAFKENSRKIPKPLHKKFFLLWIGQKDLLDFKNDFVTYIKSLKLDTASSMNMINSLRSTIYNVDFYNSIFTSLHDDPAQKLKYEKAVKEAYKELSYLF